VRRLVFAALALAAAAGGCGKAPAIVEPRTTHELVFRDPETCRQCHPDHVAEWEGAMHAYAEKDPLFIAIDNIFQNDFDGEGGQFCTQCHTVPGFLGNETRVFMDSNGFTQITPGLSTIAQHGVSCDVCHSATALDAPFNGQLAFVPDGNVRGPLTDAMPTTAHGNIESELHRNGNLCVGCHNTQLPITAAPVPLEQTANEWQLYRDGGGDKLCMDCHMPARMGQAAVDGPMRTVHAHTFVGADIALIDFPNAAEQRTLVEQLMAQSATLTDTLVQDASGTVTGLSATIKNLAGHALPSGVTSERRMWLEVTLKDAGGAVRYQTGMLDANGDLMDGIAEHSVTPNGDPDLWWFGAILFSVAADTHVKQIVVFPHRATGITTQFLDPLASATRTFNFPALAAGSYTLEVRLLFRIFQPYFMRALATSVVDAIDPALAARVPTFVIASDAMSFNVP
jgi:hypothetical protein